MKAVLFKSYSDNYQVVFESNGYPTSFVEPLQFKFINQTILNEKLLSNNYDGIILTSPRAIEAVSKMKNDSSLHREKKIYAVGEASGCKIKELFNLTASGLSCGNAENLAELIINENRSGSIFLFPCGNLKLDTIQEKLTAKEILVDPVIVYETTENENLKKQLNNLLQERVKFILVFFSPSGVSYVISHLRTMNIDWSNLLLFAIGKSTSTKLKELGVRVSGVADEPNPISLLNAVKAFRLSTLEIFPTPQHGGSI